MGSWNQTCGLSQLHIRHGQDVMVFALVKNNGHDSLCYTTPFYSPVMLPFYAKYNDYGGSEINQVWHYEKFGQDWKLNGIENV